MIDQADKLRQIITFLKQKQADTQNETSQNSFVKKTSRVITVTSGKGGVGKTNISINLAIALNEAGYRVVILDADLGLANIDVLFGLVSKNTLLEVLHNEKNILEVLTQGPGNIKFVSGGSGVEELVKLDRAQIEKFIENISLLDKIADIVIIDTGAGLSDSVMSFVMAADEVLLVTTPEPTSLTDAYAMIKMVTSRDNEKVIRVVVNRAESANEANDILKRLSAVSEKFLGARIQPLGYVPIDNFVIKAVKTQQPFTLSFPKSHAAKQIYDISKKLVENEWTGINQKSSGIRNFIYKFVGLNN